MEQHSHIVTRHTDVTPARTPEAAPPELCAVCGRIRARLTLARPGGQVPVRLCLACHHSVMKQRKMVRKRFAPSERPRPTREARLIIPREARLTGPAKYAALQHRRSRAQVAARRALDGESVQSDLFAPIRQAS